MRVKTKMVSLVVALAMLGQVAGLAFGEGEPTGAGGEQAAPLAAAEDNPRFQLTVTIPAGGATFMLPTSSYLGGSVAGKPYNWMVDWGDGSTQAAAGESQANGGISHAYVSGGAYPIVITPLETIEAWLGAFGFYSTGTGANSYENKSLLTAVAGPLTPQMTRTSAQIAGTEPAPDYEWAYMFDACASLRQAPTVEGWDKVVSAGDCFAQSMFHGCQELNQPSAFNLPQALTSVGESFATSMFFGCYFLDLPAGFNLPQGLTEAGERFVFSMFAACFGLRVLPAGFNLPQGIAAVGEWFAGGMFTYCISLTSLPAGFNLPPGINGAGDRFAYGMFIDCESLTSLPAGFNLPKSLTKAGSFFANTMFYSCSKLEGLPDGFTFPQGITSVGDNFAFRLFDGCLGLSTLPEGFNLPQGLTKVGSGFAAGLFNNCSSLISLPAGFNLPPGITEAGDDFAYRMLAGCSSLDLLPAGFNLSQGITSVGDNFAAELLYLAGSPSFQLNSDFCFPAGIPADSSNAFHQALQLSDQAPVQHRRAIFIIGDCPTPSTPRSTFDAHFGDIDVIPVNWGGGLVQLIAGSGDLNGDGIVTMDEVIIVLQATIGVAELSAAQLAAIDMDFDGTITMADVVIALKKTV